MTSNELLYVKTVADERSVTKAAKKLHVSQPSLTQAIRRIEQELEITLFTRTPSGTVLTVEGKSYYRMAESILNIYQEYLDSLKESDELLGQLSIGASWYTSTYFLANLITDFFKKYPKADIQITEKNTEDLLAMFQRGEMDAIFIHQCSYEKRTFPKSWVSKLLKTERMYLVAAAELGLSRFAVSIPECKYPRIDLSAIGEISMVKFRETQKIRQLMDYMLKKAGIAPPVLLYTYGFQNALELASNNRAVTILPEKFLEGWTASAYPVEIFDVDEQYELYWQICLCYREQENLPRTMEAFLTLFSEIRCNS